MIKVAHVTTIDLSLRYLLLNQLRSIEEAGYEVTGISSPGTLQEGNPDRWYSSYTGKYDAKVFPIG